MKCNLTSDSLQTALQKLEFLLIRLTHVFERSISCKTAPSD